MDEKALGKSFTATSSRAKLSGFLCMYSVIFVMLNTKMPFGYSSSPAATGHGVKSSSIFNGLSKACSFYPIVSASKTRQSLCNGRNVVVLPYPEAILTAQPPVVLILERKIREEALVSDEGFREADVTQDPVDLLPMINDLILWCDFHSSLVYGATDTRHRYLVYGFPFQESVSSLTVQSRHPKAPGFLCQNGYLPCRTLA